SQSNPKNARTCRIRQYCSLEKRTVLRHTAVMVKVADFSPSLRYVNPTLQFRRLELLEALRQQDRQSQRDLARAAKVSVSTVNQHIGSFIVEGWVEKQQINDRDCSYSLTSRGKLVRREMALAYLRETFVLFGQSKLHLGVYLHELLAQASAQRIALYPAGEITELALHSLGDSQVEVVALYDDDVSKHGTTLLGIEIAPATNLGKLQVDAVLVSTYKYQTKIVRRIKSFRIPGLRVITI
ncbi:winged helix-turn-helix transcriptional regulator, partial [Candidatus Bipolaricaulota bacterium]